MDQETNQIYSLLQLGMIRQRPIMLYGDSAAKRLSYIKEALNDLRTNEKEDVKLISIDLAQIDDKQLVLSDLYSDISRDQRYLLFLDNLDKTSFDVYESARLLLKNGKYPTNFDCIAGLSKEKVEPDYIDDGLVSSCLHIEI